jgi:acetolactate synthase-1/2/3 large subunit
MTYKPVILIGNGCRSNPALIEHLCSLNIPVLTTWMGIDLVAEDNQAFCGRPGIFGQRAANIIQQKADALFCFGARLDGEQVAYDYDRFSPNADIYIFDIDGNELGKFPWRYNKNHANISKFNYPPVHALKDTEWLSWCKALYNRFRPELEGSRAGEFVDTFAFISALSEITQPNDLLAVGSSSGAVNAFFQSYKVKRGQRVTVCATIGAMGADIPMAIGGAIASGRRTICVTGDGGFQLNAQELEVVHRLNLPITFFVFNNGGYNSIRVMQNARFDGRLVGCNPESGFTTPNLRKLAAAYGIRYGQCEYPDRIPDGPAIVEVFADPNWVQLPRVMAGKVGGELRTDNMEDMTPKLDPGYLRALMEYGNA